MQSNVDKIIAAANAMFVTGSSTVKVFKDILEDIPDEPQRFPLFAQYRRRGDYEQVSAGLRTSYQGTADYEVWIIEAPKAPNNEGGSYTKLDTHESSFLAQLALQVFPIVRITTDKMQWSIAGKICFVDKIRIFITHSFKAV